MPRVPKNGAPTNTAKKKPRAKKKPVGFAKRKTKQKKSKVS